MAGWVFVADAFDAAVRDAIAGGGCDVGVMHTHAGADGGTARSANAEDVDSAWYWDDAFAVAPPADQPWSPPALTAEFRAILNQASQRDASLVCLSAAALGEDGSHDRDRSVRDEVDMQTVYRVLSRHRFVIEPFAVPVALHSPALQRAELIEPIVDLIDEINSPYIGWGHEFNLATWDDERFTALEAELAHRLFAVYLRAAAEDVDVGSICAVRETITANVPLVILPHDESATNREEKA